MSRPIRRIALVLGVLLLALPALGWAADNVPTDADLVGMLQEGVDLDTVQWAAH